jgi:hypothetical protein
MRATRVGCSTFGACWVNVQRYEDKHLSRPCLDLHFYLNLNRTDSQTSFLFRLTDSLANSIMLADFRFDRMTPKGDLPRKQSPPIPVVIETCKGYPKGRSFLADSFLDCFLVAVEYFQEESLRVPTGA